MMIPWLIKCSHKINNIFCENFRLFIDTISLSCIRIMLTTIYLSNFFLMVSWEQSQLTKEMDSIFYKWVKLIPQETEKAEEKNYRELNKNP